MFIGFVEQLLHSLVFYYPSNSKTFNLIIIFQVLNLILKGKFRCKDLTKRSILLWQEEEITGNREIVLKWYLPYATKQFLALVPHTVP